jgi:hypothetical protein
VKYSEKTRIAASRWYSFLAPLFFWWCARVFLWKWKIAAYPAFGSETAQFLCIIVFISAIAFKFLIVWTNYGIPFGKKRGMVLVGEPIPWVDIREKANLGRYFRWGWLGVLVAEAVHWLITLMMMPTGQG